jgi:hypothetical protein
VWDTTYYPTVSAADTTMTNFVGGVVTTGALTGVIGANYPRSSWPLIFEAFTVSLRTISFDFNNQGDTKNGIEPLPNFYKYPETLVKCSMYEVLETYQLQSSGAPVLYFEFTLNTGVQTASTKAISSTLKSCQGHTYNFKFVDNHVTGTGQTPPGLPDWISTIDGVETISIDTNSVGDPTTAFFTVRYYNEFANTIGLLDSAYYYDFPVQVRIKPKITPDPVDQNINQLTGCTQSVFPLGYSIDGTKHVNYGIHVVDPDSNKNILLSGKSYMLDSDDGTPGDLQMDGHVMRVTIMGTVQWISYLSTRYNEDEYVAGAIYSGGFVMALYQSNAGVQA